MGFIVRRRSALLTQGRKCTRRRSYSSSTPVFAVSKEDEEFLNQAVKYAKMGQGNTFPNPAVGCVLVNQDTNEILGAGFHPQAGYPHAEVFALLEAAGHVPSGVDAAQAVVNAKSGKEKDKTIQQLAEKYISSQKGPAELFGNCFETAPVTAYVTLEPCCHHGQTPPCAESLALAKVNRVVVGFRDPNPSVDGGGVTVLEAAGVEVEIAHGDPNLACADLVKSFVKRISPKDYDVDYSWMNGARRSALRSLANTQKREGSLLQMNFNGKNKAGDEDGVDQLELDPRWMENVDEVLWREELVNLRLSNAVGKKKLALRLGQRVAKQLGAHVAQCVGHTVLLYRPGAPPVLDLEAMIRERAAPEQ
jgi:pyrimidine deaminase RibD-like protein/RNA-binding protein YhbY